MRMPVKSCDVIMSKYYNIQTSIRATQVGLTELVLAERRSCLIRQGGSLEQGNPTMTAQPQARLQAIPGWGDALLVC